MAEFRKRSSKPYEKKDFGGQHGDSRGGKKSFGSSNRSDKPSFRPKKDNDSSRSSERKPYEKRGEGTSFEKKPYERKPYGDRPSSGGYDKPRDFDKRPPYKGNSDRPSNTERRPYEKRGEGSGSSYERKPYEKRGEGTSYEKKPYERKPYGDRPSSGGYDKPRDFDKRPPYKGNSDRPSNTERRPYEKRGEGSGSSYERKPYERKPYGDRPSSGGYDNPRDFDKRPPYKGNSDRPSNTERRPYEKRGEGSGSSYERKPYERKPYGDRPSSGGYDKPRDFEKRPYQANSDSTSDSKPRRPRIDLESDEDALIANEEKFEKVDAKVATDLDIIRLNRFISNAGVCSRREADELIESGQITVNGTVVTELGTQIKPTDKVLMNGNALQTQRKVYILLNKPKDYITTKKDPEGRRTVYDLIAGACTESVEAVGRLDRNTTGILLFTNDGDLAEKIIHPKYNKMKIYHVFLDKNISMEDFQEISKGVELDDGFVDVDDLQFVDNNKDQIGIQIHSGKNHVVKRIFEKYGYSVEKLDRVYFAGMTKKNLPRGKWRFLTKKEIEVLLQGAYE